MVLLLVVSIQIGNKKLWCTLYAHLLAHPLIVFTFVVVAAVQLTAVWLVIVLLSYAVLYPLQVNPYGLYGMAHGLHGIGHGVGHGLHGMKHEPHGIEHGLHGLHGLHGMEH